MPSSRRFIIEEIFTEKNEPRTVVKQISVDDEGGQEQVETMELRGHNLTPEVIRFAKTCLEIHDEERNKDVRRDLCEVREGRFQWIYCP